MKQKAPVSNRQKTFRNLLWIALAALAVFTILQMTNSYTPAQAMRRYEHAQLIHRTEVMLQGSAPDETAYFSFWQLGKNDDVLTLTKFFQDVHGYRCYGDIADIAPGEIACVALSQSRSSRETACTPLVYGCISEPLAASLTLQDGEGGVLAQFETKDMTFKDSAFYFVFPLSQAAADSLSSVEVALRDGRTQSCALATSTFTSSGDAI